MGGEDFWEKDTLKLKGYWLALWKILWVNSVSEGDKRYAPALICERLDEGVKLELDMYQCVPH